jgi:hypothetical protein
MKIDFENLEVRRKINLLAEIAYYANMWVLDYPKKDQRFSLETVAHVIACSMVQWFNTYESIGTAEVCDLIFISIDDGTRTELMAEYERRIIEFLSQLE